MDGEREPWMGILPSRGGDEERQRQVKAEADAKAAEVQRFRDGMLPLCGIRVPGLFWIDGRPGLFVAVNRDEPGYDAFFLAKKSQVRLSPAPFEQIAEMAISAKRTADRIEARKKRTQRQRQSGIPNDARNF